MQIVPQILSCFKIPLQIHQTRHFQRKNSFDYASVTDNQDMQCFIVGFYSYDSWMVGRQ